MSITITGTVIQNGTPTPSSTNRCNKIQTTKKRTAAPVILDKRKNEAPVLYERSPNRCCK